jgi:hypothetical protein
MSQGSDQHRARLKTSYAHWSKQRAFLEGYRVGAADRRTTAAPLYQVRELFPELAGQERTTVRLHPRYGDEPALDASKLGGTFLWPAEEPWPVCPAHEIPFVSVLQLCAADFPEMPFPPGADLFQVLWCPREHADVPHCLLQPDPMYWADPHFFWRNRMEITRPRSDNPPPREAYYEYVPLPCRLLPERVIEYPSIYELPQDLVDRIYNWQDHNLSEEGTHRCSYEGELSVALGTKVGGYLQWIQDPWIPTCTCGTLMEHLLTMATVEWNGLIDRSWTPVEEHKILASFPATWEGEDDRWAIQEAFWIPTGLNLGDAGNMHLFVCRHCRDWPIVPTIECC